MGGQSHPPTGGGGCPPNIIMFDNLFDGSQVNLFVAFLAGFITFFASCLLPLVPTYLAYLSGVALNDEKNIEGRWKIFRSALFFVIGFSITFIILGATLNRFALFLAPYRLTLQRIMGAIFVLMGLLMLGIFKNRFFSSEKRLDLHNWFQSYPELHAMMVGVGFSLGWTPCIGPVLAVILFWSAQQDSLFKGILLLSSYSIGLGTPFLLVGLLFEKIIPILKKYNKVSHYVNIISGLIIIGAGLLMALDQFGNFSMLIIHAFNLSGLSI